MPGESDNNERILYTSESVGEGHPGKYQKYFLLEIYISNFREKYSTICNIEIEYKKVQYDKVSNVNSSSPPSKESI